MTEKFKFDIFFDDSFSSICQDDSLSPVQNKYLLSLANDFENGEWRYEKFHDFIFNNIAETALSKKERDSLSGEPFSVMKRSAKNLRLIESDKGQGSEIAEIVLYGIMKRHFQALPVVPKIFYKQNSNDNAKGSDSVHILIEDNDFSLWLGEAKFYNSIENVRLAEVIQSVENSLNVEKLRKENAIITNVSDLDALSIDSQVREKIKDSLSEDISIDKLKPKLHIPIFLLYECELTQEHVGSRQSYEEYKAQMIEYHKGRANEYFKKQIEKLKNKIYLYEEIKFHLILFPIPSKEEITKRFIDDAKRFRGT